MSTRSDSRTGSPCSESQMAHCSLQHKPDVGATHQPGHTLATHGPHTDPHTNKNAPKNKQPRKRKRVMPYIFGNDRLEELLWRLLDDRDPLLRAYVYPIHDDRKDDALYIGPPFHGLIAWLRDEHNGAISTSSSAAGNAWNSLGS